MFHAASVKAPLPLGEGGADEGDIVIDNLSAEINQLKKSMVELTFLGSYAFTKRVVGPPQPRRLRRNDEGEPPGGILVGWVVSVAFGPTWWWVCSVLC
jgi:hypothetical protein